MVLKRQWLPSRVRRFTSNLARDSLAKRGFLPVKLDRAFLISASNGLYLFSDGRICRLLNGNFFGITSLPNGRILTVRYVQNGAEDERSFALTFRLNEDRAEDVQPFSFRNAQDLERVPVRVHQVILHKNHLLVTNTRQNLLWKTDLDGTILQEWTYSVAFEYEPGNPSTTPLRSRARASEDYHHFNSLYADDDYIYVLAHNSAGIDKSRNSFLLQLTHDFEVISKREDIGKACHNLVPYDGDFYICDSANSRIVHKHHPTIELGMFTRGMALIDDHLLVAGTVAAASAEDRGKGFSRLFFIPMGAQKPLMSIALGRLGDIHDIQPIGVLEK